MHFSWLLLLVFAALLLTVRILTRRMHMLIIRCRIAWLQFLVWVLHVLVARNRSSLEMPISSEKEGKP